MQESGEVARRIPPSSPCRVVPALAPGVASSPLRGGPPGAEAPSAEEGPQLERPFTSLERRSTSLERLSRSLSQVRIAQPLTVMGQLTTKSKCRSASLKRLTSQPGACRCRRGPCQPLWAVCSTQMLLYIGCLWFAGCHSTARPAILLL